MSAIDILRDVLSKLGIKVDTIKFPEHIQISFLNNNSFFSNNKKVIVEGNNKLYFNFPRLTRKEKQEVLSYVRALRESKDDYLLLEQKSNETVEDIDNAKSSFKTLEKYKDLFIPEDFFALESSIYIKHLQDTNRSSQIQKFKQQIRNRFGERGNTISNLYSAGYFDRLIFPLYDEMSKSSDFNPESFRTTFDKLVRDFPLAVFIHRLMQVSEIKEKIINRVETNKRYGVKKAHIHGIGRINCGNIKQAIKELEDENYKFSKSVNEKNTIIIVTLEF